MTTDIVALIEFYEKEKAIERERVVEALEFAFCSAYRKMVPGADAIESLRAEINEKKGDPRIFASLEVVADDPEDVKEEEKGKASLRIVCCFHGVGQPEDGQLLSSYG